MTVLHSFIIITLIGCLVTTDGETPNFYWRDYLHGDIPRDALEGATGRYIGQVVHNDKIMLATINPHTNFATAEQIGKVIVTNNIKILCTPVPKRFYWEFVSFDKPHDQQMKEAVKGGYQTDISKNLFIGKSIFEGEWRIGKVLPIEHEPNKGLYLWNKEDKGVNLREFFILKYNYSSFVDECTNY